MKIGCSAPRQDFDVFSGHILYFSKVIRYKNTPNDAKENQLFNHVGNFACEIVVSLLEAFALLEANEIRNLHRAASLLCFLSNVLLNGEVAVLNERLLQEAVVLIELADSAGNHLLDEFFGSFWI